LDHAQSAETSLDALCSLCMAGDERAEARLFESLRVRFLQIAKRRVRPDHLEDVVQDALRIVLARFRDRDAERGILVWSLTVLRNVIGNYYQAKERESARLADIEDLSVIPDDTAGALAEVDQADSAANLEAAIADLARRLPRCGVIFREILACHERGGGQREISQRALRRVQRHYPDLTPGSFYTALHRCRAHLREILASREGSVGHG
jgi:DNA-directed RNA polymerase specialized sigma24 family protein